MDGDINYREFAAALKRYEVDTANEEALVDYEVMRALDKCQCKKRFKCIQTGVAPNGDVKYKFGHMQKVYLVRILATAVMVRVGGGWQEISEFLGKYDPCRAPGWEPERIDPAKMMEKLGDWVISPLDFDTVKGYFNRQTAQMTALPSPLEAAPQPTAQPARRKSSASPTGRPLQVRRPSVDQSGPAGGRRVSRQNSGGPNRQRQNSGGRQSVSESPEPAPGRTRRSSSVSKPWQNNMAKTPE